MNKNNIEVSHPCDNCGVWADFTLGSADTIPLDGAIEYYKTVRCAECGTINYQAGVYELEWIN